MPYPRFPHVAPVPWVFKQLWNAQAEGGFGYMARVWKAAECPCGSSPEEPSNINCKVCGGTGIMYPLTPIYMSVIVQDIDQDMQLTPQGELTPGTLTVATMPGGPHFDDMDLAIFPWLVGMPAQTETFTHQGMTDTLQYRAINVTGLWAVDSVAGQVFSYHPVEDFTVQGKTIQWNPHGNVPPPGTLLSIRYDALFEWVAYNPPSPNIGFGQDLGQIAVLRKRHLVLPNAPILQES